MPNCYICYEDQEQEVCERCEAGLAIFRRSSKLLHRATVYCSRRAHQERKRESTIKRLVKAQQQDMFPSAPKTDRPRPVGSAIVRIHPHIEKKHPEIRVIRDGKVISRKDCPF